MAQSEAIRDSDELFQGPHALVHSELAALNNPAQSLTQTLAIFIISMVAFAALGLFNNPTLDLVIIIGVLLFHELGHFLGMKVFGYRNIKMFFIPLFGAAVSGKPVRIEAWKDAVVALLGPIPGIVVSALMIGAYAVSLGPFAHPLTYKVATMLLIINGFNLLPFSPLDGGRFFGTVIFSRNRWIEALFTGTTGALLALIFHALGVYLLVAVGVLVVLSVPHRFRVMGAASEIAKQPDLVSDKDLMDWPRAQLDSLIEAVKQRFPQFAHPRSLANITHEVWLESLKKPTGPMATVLLLGCYGFFFLLTLVIAFVAMTNQVPLAVDKTWSEHRTAWTQALADGDYSKAIEEMDAARKDWGDFKNVSYQFEKLKIEKAKALYMLGQSKEAVALLEEVRKELDRLDINSLRVYINATIELAHMRVDKNQLMLAQELFDEALKQHRVAEVLDAGTEADLLVASGRCALNQQNASQAEKSFTEAMDKYRTVRKREQYFSTLLLLIQAQRAQGAADRALRRLAAEMKSLRRDLQKGPQRDQMAAEKIKTLQTLLSDIEKATKGSSGQ